MRKKLLTLMVVLLAFAGLANAQTANAITEKAYLADVSVKKADTQKASVQVATSADASKQVAKATATCYTYTLTTNQGFSTTYQWTDCGGVVRTQHLEKGQSTNVCAQDGTVTGGPYTKGSICH